jgi:tetratricopeptide (TPR) repeat protein
MPIQDRAKNVLECLLGSRELRDIPLVFVCHSLGGLVVKQVLRAADGRRNYSAEADAFLDSVKGVVFIATPHTGSGKGTLLDKLRLIVWPSASTLDLVRNNANLRDLNVWYRNWSDRIRHKVFYEKQRTTAGIIVRDDSSDPGLLHIDPVGVDANHLGISKPINDSDLVYIRTRDFIDDEIIPEVRSRTDYGTFEICDLPELPRSRSTSAVPIALRLVILSIVSLLLFKGTQGVFFPPDVLGTPTVAQITGAIRAKSPQVTSAQIEQFIDALRDARGDPSFKHAVEEAKKGNTRVAEGIWRQIYEDREKEQNKARQEQADAARNLAASTVTNNIAEGLSWYRKATILDPDNTAGWRGLGDAALAGGNLLESDQAFHRYLELAHRAGNERETAVGLMGVGDVLRAQGKLGDALKGYRESLAIAERLAASDRSNSGWQRDLSVSYARVGDVQVSQGKLDDALKSYRDGLAIFQRLAASDRSNTIWRHDLSVSYNKVGDVLRAQGKLDDALTGYRESLAIAERLAASDRSNSGWQRDLAVSYNKVGDVLRTQAKFDEGLKSYQNNLVITERLAASDRSNTIWQRDLAVSYYNVGEVLAAQGKLDDALKSYRNDLVITERLAASDRSNTMWQRDLSVSYDKVGDVLVEQGEFDDALKSYRDSLVIRERLAASDRSNTEWQRDLSVSYDKVGDVLVKQGEFDDARKNYRDSLAIRERLVASDRSNTEWQRDIAVSYDKISDVLVAKGKLDDALTSYRDSVAILERLAASDRSNIIWQRDLLVSYNKVGDVLVSQGKLDDALKSYRDSLAIFEPLAASNRNNTEWQRDLSVSYNKVGDVLRAQGRLDDALKSYRDGLAIADRLAASDRSNTQWQNDLQYSISRIGSLAYRFILTRDFATALEVSNLTISLAPGKARFQINRAHALMFLGRADEARLLYLRYRSEKDVLNGKSWETKVIEDFDELQKAGLSNPLMDEIEKRFETGG